MSGGDKIGWVVVLMDLFPILLIAAVAIGVWSPFSSRASGTSHRIEESDPSMNDRPPPVMNAISTSATATPVPGADDRAWYIVGRWEEYEGEARANLLRLAAVAVFYAIELINYYGVDLGFIRFPRVRDPAFHQTVTAIAVAWVLLGAGVHLWLRMHLMPAALKYVATGLDVVLLTLLLMVADGPRSPLVVGFFLIPAMAMLRFQLRLVWLATIAAMLGHAWLPGRRWDRGYSERPGATVPRADCPDRPCAFRDHPGPGDPPREVDRRGIRPAPGRGQGP